MDLSGDSFGIVQVVPLASVCRINWKLNLKAQRRHRTFWARVYHRDSVYLCYITSEDAAGQVEPSSHVLSVGPEGNLSAVYSVLLTGHLMVYPPLTSLPQSVQRFLPHLLSGFLP